MFIHPKMRKVFIHPKMRKVFLILAFIISNASAISQVTFNHVDVCYWSQQKNQFVDCFEDDITVSFVVDKKTSTIYLDEFGVKWKVIYKSVSHTLDGFTKYIISDSNGDEYYISISDNNKVLKALYYGSENKKELRTYTNN